MRFTRTGDGYIVAEDLFKESTEDLFYRLYGFDLREPRPVSSFPPDARPRGSLRMMRCTHCARWSRASRYKVMNSASGR